MIELLPLSIGIGLAVSLILSEALGMAGAGLVVPGYFALQLTNPMSVALTMGAGIAAYAAVRIMGSAMIIFGRRRTIMMILAGYLVGMLGRRLVTGAFGGDEFYNVIGFIIPGLIAIWIDRRGLVESICSLLTASVIVRLILILVIGEGLHQ